MKSDRKDITILILTGSVLLLLALIWDIPASDGFNPSDDGVILAQSYRLLQGEIPHLDFISIRPVGSAILHLPAFFFPGALEMTARWFVLIQYLVYSLIWAWIFYRLLPAAHQKPAILIFLSVVAYLLNQNHYNLFPWTTIDALFLFSLALLFYTYKRFVPALLLAAWAALCRQTFMVPFGLLGLAIAWPLIRQRRWFPLLLAMGAAALPFMLYLLVLIRFGAVTDWLSQMTGRTELWETGFLRFWNAFWDGPFIFLWLLILALTLYERMVMDKSLRGTESVFGVLLFIISMLVPALPAHLFIWSFALFWMGWLLLIRTWVAASPSSLSKPAAWVLLLAWTSAISLGDNAPVFATGLLAIAGFALVFSTPDIRIRPYLIYAALLPLTVWSLYAQKNNNYRDRRATELTHTAGEVFSGLGSIRTNARTYAYLNEVRRIYHDLDKPAGQFAVLPNGALLYPLLDSPNPMPLDWMQGAEFVGQEKQVEERLLELKSQQEMYFLVEKINSKWMSDSLIPADFSLADYRYMDLIHEHTRVVDSLSSEWFELRVWK